MPNRTFDRNGNMRNESPRGIHHRVELEICRSLQRVREAILQNSRFDWGIADWCRRDDTGPFPLNHFQSVGRSVPNGFFFVGFG